MLVVVRAGWPDGVDERIVDLLLDGVDDALVVVVDVGRELSLYLA